MGAYDSYEQAGGSLGSQESALRLREVVKKMARDEIGDPHPVGRIGRVVKVDNLALRATVWFPGDDAPVEVNLLSEFIPITADVDSAGTQSTSSRGWGGRVWVERVNGRLYVTAVLSGGSLAAPASSMEQHTYMVNPDYGSASQAFGIQTGSQVSFFVPIADTENNYIGFGPFGGPITGFTEITIVDQKFGGTKTYNFAGLANFNAAFSNNQWYKVIPSHINPPLDFFTDIGDFDLEIGNTAFTSKWDGLDYYMMALRIQRKNDNQPSYFGEADGYRIVMRNHFGVTSQKEPLGFFDFIYWGQSFGLETAQNYGAVDFSYTLGQGPSGPYPSPQLDYPRRAQFALRGPDTVVTWDGTYVKWTGSFLVEGGGSHTHTARGGYTQFGMPTNGTVLNVIGDSIVTTRTVTASGILLNPGDTLYHMLKIGGDSTADLVNFVIVGNNLKDSLIPAHWILVAQYTKLDESPITSAPTLKLGTGELLDYWHFIGAAGQPAFTNSWVNYAVNIRVAFRKQAGSVVYLKGMCKNGTVNTAAFTLPAGYRPLEDMLMSTMSASAAGRVDIKTTGAVHMTGPSINSWVSLDGMSFIAEQ